VTNDERDNSNLEAAIPVSLANTGLSAANVDNTGSKSSGSENDENWKTALI
jgi:hypothetical protein